MDDFEAELADYTGAPYAVTVDSCTNALLLALVYERERFGLTFGWNHVELPKQTYVGVLQAARNAGFKVRWANMDWQGHPAVYGIRPTRVIDAARHLASNSYPDDTLTCLSFHAAKQLPLGRGGAILTDDPKAAEWLRAARMDGRPPGAPIEDTLSFGAHCPCPPDVAARGLWILSRWNDAGYSPPPLPEETYPDLSLLG